MRAKEFLSELLNKSLPLDWDVRDSSDYVLANFNVKGKHGQVKFYKELYTWTIDFFIDGRWDITGLGDEHVILGTVSHAIQEFVSKYDPEQVAFSAKEPSRAKLYRRMVPRILSGYSVDPELSQHYGFGLKKTEDLSEAVSRADELGHFRNRIALAARLCTALGDRPLIFRAMTHKLTNTKGGTLLAKVDHSDIKDTQNRKGGMNYEAQYLILQKLGIQHPTFTTLQPPYDAREFHGKAHIFIPLNDNPPWWSPRVKDLGGADIIDDNGQPYDGKQPNGSTLTHWMVPYVDKYAATYKHEWPSEFTKHEIIFDADTYYLLEMESFLTKFAGKEFKSKIDVKSHRIFKRIDASVWDHVKTYTDVANFLTTTAPSYLDWWEFELPKIKADEERRSALYLKIHDEWVKGGGFTNPKRQEEIAKELGIPLGPNKMPL